MAEPGLKDTFESPILEKRVIGTLRYSGITSVVFRLYLLALLVVEEKIARDVLRTEYGGVFFLDLAW